MSDEGKRLGQDVFIALAAIGWADGNLDANEADAIVRTAADEGLELDEIEAIEKATKNRVDVGAIDLGGMTKADRLFVYATGVWVSRVDGHVADEEKVALEKLGERLKIPARPREIAEGIVVEIGKLSESEEPAFYNLPKLRETLKRRLAEAARLRTSDDDVE